MERICHTYVTIAFEICDELVRILQTLWRIHANKSHVWKIRSVNIKVQRSTRITSSHSSGVGPPLCHLWFQAWTDKDYLNLRALLRTLFDIISSSGCSPEELFLRSGNSPASVQLSVCKHFLLSHLLQDHWSDLFWNLVRISPSVFSCASIKKKEFRSVDKHGRRRPSLIFLVIASPQKLLDGFITRHTWWTYHTSCVRITDVKNSSESFTEVKDSHVFVKSVKNSTLSFCWKICFTDIP